MSSGFINSIVITNIRFIKYVLFEYDIMAELRIGNKENLKGKLIIKELDLGLVLLLKKHYAETISPDERIELHKKMEKKYQLGDFMEEYRCPNCNKPLMLTWNWGPICLWDEKGCGYKP